MTPVIFHIVTPKGEPVANAKIKINLSRAAFNEDDAVTIMPRPITVVTDAQGSVTVPLVPCTRLYIMTVEDGPTCGYMQFRFFVPELASGETAVNFEKIIVDFPVSNKNYDEEALLLIHQTKNDVLDALASTVENLNETVVAKNAAQTAAVNSKLDADASEAASVAAQNALSAAMLVQGNDYDAKSKKIVNVANATQPSDVVNLGLLDSRTATLNQAITTAQTQADKGVNDAADAKARADQGVVDAGIAYQNAVNARAVADAAFPKAGGDITGPVNVYMPGAAQPRIAIETVEGEPTITFKRWTGFSTNDAAWRIKNNNGFFQIQYALDSRDNNAMYATKLYMDQTTINAEVLFRAKTGILVGDNDGFIQHTSALLEFDGGFPAPAEPRQVMRLRVKGIPDVSFAGSFNFYTSSGPQYTYRGYTLRIHGADTSSGVGDALMILTGEGVLAAKALQGVRIPVASANTGGGQGWMKIAKVRMGALGADFVIRVSGTTSYSAIPNGSNGSLTTITGRIDNDNQIRGSVYAEGYSAFGHPSDVIFGVDGTIYMLCGQFWQLSVHNDSAESIWESQSVVYHSASSEPPAGNRAIKSFSIAINGLPNFSVNEHGVNTSLPMHTYDVMPSLNAQFALGTASFQYTTAYLSTGAINASDERLKRDFRALNADEIAAGRAIGRAIGVYRWKDAVEAKGTDAREHIGPTVQKVIGIMTEHGLDPFNYGFICHDEWEATVIEHAGVEATEAVPPTKEIPAVVDEDGTIVVEYQPATQGYPAFPAVEARTEVVREAGDRYAFRYDELNMFINAATVAYQDQLEQRLLALEAAQ